MACSNLRLYGTNVCCMCLHVSNCYQTESCSELRKKELYLRGRPFDSWGGLWFFSEKKDCSANFGK